MTLRRTTSKLSLLLVVIALAACEEPALAGDAGRNALLTLPNDVVLEWNDHTIAAIVAHDGYADPLVATRALAIVHPAMHDAVNASSHRITSRTRSKSATERLIGSRRPRRRPTAC